MPTPSQTQVILSQVMRPEHQNLVGTVHGGNIMKFVDDAAGAVASRFSGGPAVTAAMDQMLFRRPVRIGDIVTVRAQINWTGHSSMEVGARVETTRFNELSPSLHVATAFLVMVAVDADGRPRPIDQITPETDEEKRRFRAAEIRREHRLAARDAIEKLGQGTASIES